MRMLNATLLGSRQRKNTKPGPSDYSICLMRFPVYPLGLLSAAPDPCERGRLHCGYGAPMNTQLVRWGKRSGELYASAALLRQRINVAGRRIAFVDAAFSGQPQCSLKGDRLYRQPAQTGGLEVANPHTYEPHDVVIPRASPPSCHFRLPSDAPRRQDSERRTAAFTQPCTQDGGRIRCERHAARTALHRGHRKIEAGHVSSKREIHSLTRARYARASTG
jgi:hypothetical protein